MRHRFVATQNVARFVKAADQAAGRAAPEKRIIVVTGEAGLGKSRTAVWWTVQRGAVMIQAHPASTPAWLLRDLARELMLPLKRTTEELHGQIVGALAADPRPIVLDEVEHALRRDAVGLDALRQVVDLVEVPLVLVGREGSPQKLHHHKQIWRRIGAVAEFQRLDPGDVRLIAQELVETPEDGLPAAVLAAVLEASGGLIDGVIDGLARAEAAARRLKREIRPADVPGLGHPWARKEARIVSMTRRAAETERAAKASGRANGELAAESA